MRDEQVTTSGSTSFTSTVGGPRSSCAPRSVLQHGGDADGAATVRRQHSSMSITLSSQTLRRICAGGAILAWLGLGSSAQAEPSDKPPEVGHNYSEHETPRMTALGGAVRSTSNSLTALYSNPANLAAAQVYHVGAMAQIYPESRRQSYGGAIVDSLISSTGLAGGLGGIWTMQDPDGIRREWMDLRFALGLPLGDTFLIGLTGKYITLQQNGYGPLGFSEASGGLKDTNIIQTITFDAGATLRPIPQLFISLTGHNLSNPETSLLPLMGGLGLGFTTGEFGLNADAVLESRLRDQAQVRVNVGGEVLVADRVALRLGYRFDQAQDSQAVSGGLGYVDPKYAIDASVRRGVVGEPYTAVVFGFSVHLESLGLGSSNPDSY